MSLLCDINDKMMCLAVLWLANIIKTAVFIVLWISELFLLCDLKKMIQTPYRKDNASDVD